MAEANAQNVQPIRQLGQMQVLVGGLIKETRLYNGHQYTTIACPAKDEFSMPSVIEVKSARKLGDVGARVPGVLCNISGFLSPFQYIEEGTGQRKSGTRPKVYFEVVE